MEAYARPSDGIEGHLIISQEAARGLITSFILEMLSSLSLPKAIDRGMQDFSGPARSSCNMWYTDHHSAVWHDHLLLRPSIEPEDQEGGSFGTEDRQHQRGKQAFAGPRPASAMARLSRPV